MCFICTSYVLHWTGATAHQGTWANTATLTLTTAKIISVKTGPTAQMQWTATRAFALKVTGKRRNRVSCLEFCPAERLQLISATKWKQCIVAIFFSGLFCEFSPPMVLPRTSPCDNFDCQNGAQCIIRINEPICQCLPGYQGEKCEKLVSVNFVNKESYLQIPSAKVRPQTNITLQVSHIPCPRSESGFHPKPPSTSNLQHPW